MSTAGCSKMEVVIFTVLLLLLQKMICQRYDASGDPSKGNVHRRIRAQISKMELCAEIVISWKPLAIFAKSSILDVRQGSLYVSDVGLFFAL